MFSSVNSKILGFLYHIYITLIPEIYKEIFQDARLNTLFGSAQSGISQKKCEKHMQYIQYNLIRLREEDGFL